LAHAVRYRAWRDRLAGPAAQLAGIDAASAARITGAFLVACPEGGWLPAAGTAQLLACYQIPAVRTRVATSAASAAAAAAEFGGPVVLKAEADGLVHKSDAGAVQLDLRTRAEVTGAYQQLAAAFGSSLRGVLVQPILAGGVETLVGVVQEPLFGPLVVFGLGGVATEVLGDHVTRLAPITPADADEMVRGVHAAPLLTGYRGAPPVDTAALADLLLRVSRLASDLPEVAELDLNPVIARADGVCAVDARVRVVPAAPRDPFLRRLR
jgi:acyl-CoA synthetase (NDP forming)